MAYLMECPKESERLLNKSDFESSRNQLLTTGLSEGMIALDAGGGAGFVTRIMSEIVGATGRAILVDQSSERLKAAEMFNADQKNVAFLRSSLEKINLEDNVVDYTFCRFVFEYLASPEIVFDELLRVTKPGGRLVIGDLDYNVLTHYPLATHLEQQLNEIVSQLQRLELWDPYAGRKLFHHFQKAGLSNIRVQLLPHHLIYGQADMRDVRNWESKLTRMEELVREGLLKLNFDIKIFRNEFLNFFNNPLRFSYSPLILVSGTKY